MEKRVKGCRMGLVCFFGYQSAAVSVLALLLRRVPIVEVAHAAVGFGIRGLGLCHCVLGPREGKEIAYAASARKMLTVIWHLLVNGERYAEDGFEKTAKSVRRAYAGHVPLEVMAEVLRSAGYIVSGPSGLEQKGFS